MHANQLMPKCKKKAKFALVTLLAENVINQFHNER